MSGQTYLVPHRLAHGRAHVVLRRTLCGRTFGRRPVLQVQRVRPLLPLADAQELVQFGRRPFAQAARRHLFERQGDQASHEEIEVGRPGLHLERRQTAEVLPWKRECATWETKLDVALKFPV
jgi:hypothetical protein